MIQHAVDCKDNSAWTSQLFPGWFMASTVLKRAVDTLGPFGAHEDDRNPSPKVQAAWEVINQQDWSPNPHTVYLGFGTTLEWKVNFHKWVPNSYRKRALNCINIVNFDFLSGFRDQAERYLYSPMTQVLRHQMSSELQASIQERYARRELIESSPREALRSLLGLKRAGFGYKPPRATCKIEPVVEMMYYGH